MKKTILISLPVFFLFGLVGVCRAQTAPAISGVTGSVSQGSSVTINGQQLVQEDTSHFDSAMSAYPTFYGFEGTGPAADGLGAGTYDSNVKLAGNKSVRFSLGEGTTWAPSNQTDFWWRTYFRYHKTSGSWYNVGSKMLCLYGGNDGWIVGPDSDSDYSQYLNIFYGGVGHNVSFPGGRMQADRWYSLEVHFRAIAPYEITVWLDGASLGTWYPTTSSGPGDHVSFGLMNITGPVVLDAWHDAMAFASERLYPLTLVEIGNGPNYATATKRTQALTSVSDGSVGFTADLAGLGSGPYYLFVTNNRQQVSSAYALSGGAVSDTVPPSQVASLIATAVSGSQINLAWNAASDNVGVAGYRIFRNGVSISTTATTSYSDTGLSPATAYTYSVQAYDAANNNGTQSQSVSATTLSAQVPTISSFSANPTAVNPGQSATLSWVISGATQLSIDQGIGIVTGSSRSVTPAATATYTLTATNAAGSSTSSVQLTVNSAPALPVISSFAVSPNSIIEGSSSTLSWSVSGASSVAIDQGIGTVSSSGTTTVTPGQTTVYKITASNSAGSSIASAQLSVNAPTIPKDGTLIKDANIATVYVMEYSLKRPFSSMNVFRGLGYKTGSIKTIDTSGIVMGIPLTTPSQRHVRGTNVVSNKTIYFLGKDLRYPFPSKSVYFSWGCSFSEVVEANSYDLSMGIGPVISQNTGSVQGAVTFAEGSLVKGSFDTVYLFEGGLLKPFTSEASFLARGYSFDRVVPVLDDELGGFRKGNEIK